jgi:threonyl-tRNA synthetase
MLHLALFGSIERFLGMYIEHTEGKFPLWFNPVHGVIISINDKVDSYCNKLFDEFKKNGFRINYDQTNETLNYKIREYSLQKVPFLLIIGDKERNKNAITIRTLGSEKTQTISVKDFIKKLSKKISDKSLGFNL